MRVLCLQVCLCQTCSDKELLYFFDMRFLIVSLTDLTFLPSEIRDVVGDFTTSLYIGSCSLFCNYKGSENRERWTKEQGDDGEETNERKEEKTAEKRRFSVTGECSLWSSQPLRILQALTFASEPVLTTWSERLDRSKPPKLQVLCGGAKTQSNEPHLKGHITETPRPHPARDNSR